MLAQLPISVLTVQSTKSEKSIKAVPLRHPFRWAAAVFLALVALAFIIDAANRKAYEWKVYRKYFFDSRFISGSLVTIELTAISMIIGVVLGIALAIMRRSPNPILRGVAVSYIWFFRGTPVYVQLVFWGFITTIYTSAFIGIPFLHFKSHYLGYHFPLSQNTPVFLLAILGLGLNEAAYMAEIVRAGLLSVDVGQEEAALSLGFSWWQTMTKIVIPQALRIIIPPTGNETISMLKTTSLVSAIPLLTDIYGRTTQMIAATYDPVPLLLIASTYYLAMTSVMMVIQYFVEKHYSKGHAELKVVNVG
jgi:polar amino acid transport system permease protein